MATAVAEFLTRAAVQPSALVERGPTTDISTISGRTDGETTGALGSKLRLGPTSS